MTRILLLTAVCILVTYCTSLVPGAADYEVAHQRAIAAGHYTHATGYYEYQQFTQANP